MNIIEGKNIKKKYGKKVILDGADISVREGECVAIVGANGCGKSTLLGILSGTLKADAGEILYNGMDIYKDRRRMAGFAGYVPQENPLMENLSVYDNLRLWYCDSKRSIKDDMENGILKEFGLDKYAGYDINKLSGGLKKRLSIACALASDPKLLIMDEPGAALDIICKEDIKRYLKEYMDRGGTVIITSHEMAELSICTRMLHLNGGRLVELKERPLGDELLDIMKGKL